MLSRIHNKLGTAGLVVAIVALVAALGGAAWAASDNHLSGGEKKEVKKIAKQFAGKKGATGAQGPQGPAGPTGAPGAAGAKGATGAAGAKGATGPAGAKGATGAAGAKGATGANGTFGSEPLPSGQTLTGTWATGGEGHALAAISFPIPVSPAPTGLWSFEQSGITFGLELQEGSPAFFGPFPEPESLEEAEEDEEAYRQACPGSAAAPSAAPGFLCAYKGTIEGANVTGPEGAPFGRAVTEFGTSLAFIFINSSSSASGTWAVTAE